MISGRAAVRSRPAGVVAVPALVAGVAAIAAGAAAVDAWSWRHEIHPDWLIARAAGHDLIRGSHLTVYAHHPRAQMGPLALVAAQMPRQLYCVLVAALLAVPLWCIGTAARGLPDTPGRRVTLALGAALAVAPWAQLAWKGHADDALVLAGGAAALALLHAGRRGLAIAAFAVAVAGKPTAVLFAPAMCVDADMALLVVLAFAAIWGPFAIATPSALFAAGRGVMPVGRGSLPHLLGYPVSAPIPVWVRPVQLLAALVAGNAGRLRDRVWEGLVLALAIRALVETNPAPAYSIPLVVLAILPDLRRGYPLLTVLAFASWRVSDAVLAGQPGHLRLALLLGIAIVAIHDLGLTGARWASERA